MKYLILIQWSSIPVLFPPAEYFLIRQIEIDNNYQIILLIDVITKKCIYIFLNLFTIYYLCIHIEPELAEGNRSFLPQMAKLWTHFNIFKQISDL